jgi:large subunit ribosomal protein L4
MTKIAVVDIQGNQVREIELNPELFAATVNPDLMAQAVRTRMFNAWLGTRKTKNRGEVSGGGRKPWRQKGTGRARHGSIRSPIWVGGGHAHALTPIDKSLKMPKKMRRRALFSALTVKLQNGEIRVLEDLKIDEPKSKAVAEILKKVGGEQKVLLVTAHKEMEIERAIKNIPNVTVIEARLLHPFEILHCNILILSEGSLEILNNTFADQEK